MSEIYCKVTVNGLVPMYDSDLEEKKRLKIGATVLCSIKKPRNYQFHKKFMALIRLTFDNLPEHLHDYLSIYSEEDMLRSIKLDLGLSSIKTIAGRDHVIEGSISFAKMDELEFERFYKRSIDIILNVYLRGCDYDSLRDEILRFM